MIENIDFVFLKRKHKVSVKKKLIIFLVLASFVGACPASYSSSWYIGSYSGFKTYLNDASTDKMIILLNLNADSSIGTPSSNNIIIESINSSVINGNSYSGFSTAAGRSLTLQNLGSFSVNTDGGLTLSFSMNGFYSTYGGLVYNTGQTSIINSAIYNNYATNNGGAVSNNDGCNFIIKDSVFVGNRADNTGGAISNAGILYIIADKKDVNFSENSLTSGTPNAINNLRNGVVNLNAGEKSVIFNDSITGTETSTININKTLSDDLIDSPVNGKIVLNNEMSGFKGIVNFLSGTLKLGSGKYKNLAGAETNTTPGLFGSAKSFNVFDGAVFDLQNGRYDDVQIDKLVLDDSAQIGLKTDINDRFNVTNFEQNNGEFLLQSVDINNINYNDGDLLFYQLTYSIGDAVKLAADTELVSKNNDDNKYLGYRKDGVNGYLSASVNSLKTAVNDYSSNKFYNMNKEEVVNDTLGYLGGIKPILTVNANNNSISAVNNSGGISVGNDGTLNINKAGSYKLTLLPEATADSILMPDGNNYSLTITDSVNGFNVNSGSGAFVFNAGNTNIIDSVFKDNYIGGYGGVLYNYQGEMTIKNSIFSENSSLSGGALGNDKNLSVSGSIFAGNKANVYGGAVYNQAGSVSDFDKTAFKSNISTTGSGGAVYNSGNTTIKNSSFDANKTQIYGGGVYNDSGAEAVIETTVFKGNMTVDGSGGAAYNDGKSKISGSEFISNESKNYGGALFNSNKAIMTVDTSEFKDNKSSDGGAVNNEGQITLTGSTFNNNTSTIYGGAIRNISTGFNPDGTPLNADLTIAGSKFEGNSSGSGGAVYNNGIARISNTEFKSNKVNVYGGAIYNEIKGSLLLEDSVFENNESQSGGALANSGITSVIDSSFKGNQSKIYGGAIFNTANGIINLIALNKDIEFTGNLSKGNSSGLYLDNGTVNLNAGSKSFIFNDKIDGSAGTININKSGIKYGNNNSYTAPSNGTIILNNDMTGFRGDVNLYNGTLKLGSGQYANSTRSIINTSPSLFTGAANFSAYGGTIDVQDGKTENYIFNNLALNGVLRLEIDANINNDKADYFDASSVSGTGSILISALNVLDGNRIFAQTIIADKTLKDYISFSLIPEINITPDSYKNNYGIKYVADENYGYITFERLNANLNTYVNATDPQRIYAMVNDENLNADLGKMAGADSTLIVNGGGNAINGSSYKGIEVALGQSFAINNTGEYKLIEASPGTLNSFQKLDADGVLKTYTADTSTGVNSFSSDYGSVIKNSGNFAVSNSNFINNSSVNRAGVIDNKGSITSIAANFINNTTSGYGGAIYNDNGTMTSITGDFVNNNAEIEGGALYNYVGSIDKINANFLSNTARVSGGAVLNTNLINNITGSFIGNRTDGIGGAIFNTKEIKNITAEFINNYANQGGAVNNYLYSSITFTDSSFTDNTALTSGGAVFNHKDSLVNITAKNRDVVFTGNKAGSLSNAIHNDNGTLNLNASEGKSVIFNDRITGSGTININGQYQPGVPIDGTVLINEDMSGYTGDVNLFAGILKLGNGKYIDSSGNSQNVSADPNLFANASSINAYDGAKVDIRNDKYDNVLFNHLTLTGTLKLAIEVDVENEIGDFINASSHAGSGDISISDISLWGDRIYSKTAIAGSELKDLISLAVNPNITINNTLFRGNYGIIYDKSDADFGYLIYDRVEPDLKNYVNATDADRMYVMQTEEEVFESLGIMGGDDSSLTIAASGNSITAKEENISGIIIENGQTLNVSNVGNPDDYNQEDSALLTGWNSFENVLTNSGEVNINNSVFFDNKGNAGSVINNKSDGKSSVNDSIFFNNKAEGSNAFGGAVKNSGIMKTLNSQFYNNSADKGGAIYNDGLIILSDNTFTGNTASDSGGAIYNKSNVLSLIALNKDVVFEENYSDKISNSIHNDNGTINLNSYNDKSIIFNDRISGNNGILNINKDLTSSDGIDLSASEGTIIFNNMVSDNDVNLYKGTVKFGSYKDNFGSFDNTVNFNVFGCSVDLVNNTLQNANLGNLNLYNDLELKLDANLASKEIDTITADSFNSNGNKINILGLNILQPAQDIKFSISPIGENIDTTVKADLMKAINYIGADTIYSPIYKYHTAYNQQTGEFDFNRYGAYQNESYENFNPSVFAASTAAQIGGYLQQLNSYDQAFINMDTYMLMSSKERRVFKYRNKYASASETPLYKASAMMQSMKGAWYKPYTTFENVPLKRGPKVSNVAYGSFFGGDSEIMDFENGWEAIFSGYSAYNGSHQTYDGVSLYQNGGTMGLTGVAYKGNFFTGLTVNAGASAVEASTMYGHDDFTMLMGGIASKTGYNFEFGDGKFIIQPNYMMSYTFVNTFDFNDAAGVRIKSDPLHAIQLEPGIKFIANFNNGWQPYLGVSMVWNIMDKTKFEANEVTLPELSVKPFVRYGIGVQKKWGERFMGFFQTFLTNGGRNGVGLQFGFRWTI